MGETSRFYKSIIIDGEVKQYNQKEFGEDIRSYPNFESRKHAEYCVHFLFFFIPLNPSEFTFTAKQDVKHTLDILNTKAKGMEKVAITSQSMTSPLYSFNCTTVTGFPIYEDKKQND